MRWQWPLIAFIDTVALKHHRGGEVCDETGPSEETSEIFLAGGEVSCRQNVQIPRQDEPKFAKSLPLQGKCHSNSSPGNPREIIACPCPTPTFPAIGCLGRKTLGLSSTGCTRSGVIIR